MSRSTVTKLTDTKIRGDMEPRMHPDGDGLYLRVSKSGTKAWVFVWIRQGKRREMGFGAYPQCTLAAARQKRQAAHDALSKGGDPAEARKRAAASSLVETAKLFRKHKGGDASAKVADRWVPLIERHGGPLCTMPIEKITAAEIATQLRKVQAKAPTQAAALQALLARVFAYAGASGYRDGDNPADWRGKLTFIMADLGKEPSHHPALPYADVPAFIAKLQASSRRTSQAVLLFAILCACRSMEAVGARWEEIDLATGVWTIPASRMKGKQMHRVPLSSAALAVLQAQKPKRSGYVFEGRQKGKPFGASTMRDAMERMGAGGSPHGFRTCFRAWSGAQGLWSDSLLERCLAHLVGTEVTRSYDREDYLEQRRPIMEAWGQFCMREAAALT